MNDATLHFLTNAKVISHKFHQLIVYYKISDGVYFAETCMSYIKTKSHLDIHEENSKNRTKDLAINKSSQEYNAFSKRILKDIDNYKISHKTEFNEEVIKYFKPDVEYFLTGKYKQLSKRADVLPEDYKNIINKVIKEIMIKDIFK